MSTVTIQTPNVGLFNGNFRVAAKISYTVDTANRKVKVKVEGIRGYSTYGWNFDTNIELGIASSAEGAEESLYTGTLDFSGSDGYEGWLPRNGYDKSCIIAEKTFNFNANGTKPSIFIYLRGYRYNIWYISAGKYVHVDTSTVYELSEDIENISPLKPELTIRKTKETLTEFGVECKVTNNADIVKWERNVYHNRTADEYDNMESKTFNNSLKTFTETFKPTERRTYDVEVIAYPKGWQTMYDYTVSDILTFDCRQPLITDFKLVPKTESDLSLQFKTDFDCEWKFDRPSGTTGWVNTCSAGQLVDASVPAEKGKANAQYTLHVRRTYNKELTNSRTHVGDTSVPIITVSSVEVLGDQLHLVANSDSVCKDWKITLFDSGGSPITTQSLDITSTNSVDIMIGSLKVGQGYKIVVAATKVSNGLTGVTSRQEVNIVGGINVFIDGQVRKGSVKIYNTSLKKWETAVPYIYNSASKQWTECI